MRRRGQFDEIALGPLEGGEIATLAQHVVGHALATQQAHWLAGATEGNPLFVIETAQLLHDEDAAHLTSPEPISGATGGAIMAPAHLAKLPQSVLTVIDARLARLSKSARTLAEVAAVIGRSFTMRVLVAASAMSEDQVVDALDELWRRRIIREREIDAYDFSHDRIRDGAYANISAMRRRYLHKRVAAAIIHSNPNALDEVSGQLGYHFEEANERLSAIEYYLRAATVASAHYAHQEALHDYDRVLALAQPTEHAIRFEALLHRDRILEIVATITVWAENIRLLRQVADATVANVEGADVEMATRRAFSEERAARAATRAHNYELAIVHARQAVDAARMTDDVALQALCHYSLGLRVWHIADFAAAIFHLEEAITLAREVSDSDILASALEIRAQTYMFNGGEVGQIVPLLEESLSHYDKVGSLQGRCQILNKLAYIEFAQGTGIYEGACEKFREAIVIARQMSSPSTEIMLARNLAITLTCMGNYAAAETALEHAFALNSQLGRQHDDPVLLNYSGFLRLSQGRLADALSKQQRALAGLTALSHAQWRVKALTALGWIFLRLQEPDAADEYLETALVVCRQINEKRQLAYALICRGILRTARAQLAAARCDFEEARAILHSFEMYNRAVEAEAGLAYLALLEGDFDSALGGAHAILAHLEAHPVDFTEDVCQLLLSCYQILNRLDAAALPRLCTLIDQHLRTRTATLDAATQRLFWQIPAHQALRQACQVRAQQPTPA